MLTTLRILSTLTRYEGCIVPAARNEIRRWTTLAAAIPDRHLRQVATTAIVADAGNAEAAAAFAAFAPTRLRRRTVELMVAWQVLIDYIDALGELAHPDPLGRCLELGAALTATIAAPIDPAQHKRLSGDDAGYLATLIGVCRHRLDSLPAAAAIRDAAAEAAARCGAALAHTHAAALAGDTGPLQAWAEVQSESTSYAWWEIAAGANSNVGVLALLAAATEPTTTSREADAIASAYWPHICVLSTLLDSLVDLERDAGTGNFSFVGEYADQHDAERCIVAAAARSHAAVQPLHRSETHAMIVCGVAAFYAAEARHESVAARVSPRVLEALRPTSTPIATALRIQRRLKRRARL